MNWCIELAAAAIRQAVWDLRLIAKTDERKKVIAEYIKLGSCKEAAKALGMKEQGVRKIVTDDRIGRDAYDFLTSERLEVWGKMTGLDTQYLRKEIAKYNDLLFTPNIVE